MSAEHESKIADLTARLKIAREDIVGLLLELGLCGNGRDESPTEHPVKA